MSAEDEKALDAAIDVLAVIGEHSAKVDILNQMARDLYGDPAPEYAGIPDSVLTPILRLVDASLGEEDLAYYFLFECNLLDEGGEIREKDGTVWRLKTLDDLRAYAKHLAALKEPKP